MLSTLLRKTLGFVLFVVVTTITIGGAMAQEDKVSARNAGTDLAVTAMATAERLRFSAPNAVVQLRLEVYDESGHKVFDTEQRGGSVLDWPLQGGDGERLADGKYVCVVTVKSLSGHLSQKLGQVTLAAQQASIDVIAAAQLNALQLQSVGPIEEGSALSGLTRAEHDAAVVLAHDGTDGQVARTRGALAFRVGDFFSGSDREQMRLTEDGNLGLGTRKPQAKLDVVGDIRATGLLRLNKGIEFADGTVQTSGFSGRKDQNGNMMPAAAGAGTQNQLAKWLDNAGNLGDAAVTEVGGRVGIGVLNPSYRLVVGSDIGPGLTTSDLTVSRGPGQSVSAFVGASGSNGMNFGWDEANKRAFVNAPSQSPITFTHGGVTERMRIDTLGTVTITGGTSGSSIFPALLVRDSGLNSLLRVQTNGNVGIGTISARSKLDVRGNIQLGAAGNLFAPGGEENLRIIRGVFDGAGNIIVGSGFTVLRTEIGHYDITFSTPFTGPPAFTAVTECCDLDNQGDMVVTNGVTASTVHLIVGPRGGFADAPVHFIAIGPR